MGQMAILFSYPKKEHLLPLVYRIGDHLFTGDTLFADGWGRTDLPGGDEHAIMASLRQVIPLARTMPFHPGHGDDQVCVL